MQTSGGPIDNSKVGAVVEAAKKCPIESSSTDCKSTSDPAVPLNFPCKRVSVQACLSATTLRTINVMPRGPHLQLRRLPVAHCWKIHPPRYIWMAIRTVSTPGRSPRGRSRQGMELFVPDTRTPDPMRLVGANCGLHPARRTVWIQACTTCNNRCVTAMFPRTQHTTGGILAGHHSYALNI